MLDEIKVDISLCELDYGTFKLFPYRFNSLGDYVIDTNLTVKELKLDLIEKIRARKGIELNIDNLMIREQITGRPSRVKIIYLRLDSARRNASESL